MSDYTVEDFANAKFATTLGGLYSAHRESDGWCAGGSERFSDARMLGARWIPVPDKAPGLTMARGDYNEWLEHVESLNVSNRGAVNMTLRRLGVNVPDPKPTNSEKLDQLHDQYRMFPAQHLPGDGSLADYLDHKGVKAPDHD